APGSGNSVPGSITTPNLGGANCAGGVMFNVNPFVDIFIDSIKARANSTATNSIVRVYTRNGTFEGNETTPAAWSLHATVMIPGTTAGQQFNIPLPSSIDVAGGTTRGIY